MFGDFSTSDQLLGEIGTASNVNSGVNPDYALSDFLADFPQFSSACTAVAPAKPTIPTTLSQKFIDMASASISQSKYGEIWSYCMGLYVAHLCTMYLSAIPSNTTTQGIVGRAKPAMLQASKSVGDVSTSYDTSSISDDLKGFGSLKMTTYGQQLATWAKMAGIGGAYIR